MKHGSTRMVLPLELGYGDRISSIRVDPCFICGWPNKLHQHGSRYPGGSEMQSTGLPALHLQRRIKQARVYSINREKLSGRTNEPQAQELAPLRSLANETTLCSYKIMYFSHLAAGVLGGYRRQASRLVPPSNARPRWLPSPRCRCKATSERCVVHKPLAESLR